MNTIEKLKKKENFTGVEISLADYILKNIDHVQNMSLQELAAASYVSKPSAIRLYRKLGFKNYREFSVALQVEKIRYLSTASIFAEAIRRIYEEVSIASIFDT